MMVSCEDSAPLTTADLCDGLGEGAQVIGSELRDYGGRRSFSGRAATIKCFEDNSLIREAVHSPGEGRVLVVDGGGSARCALVGDMLAKAAAANGWAGIVIDGSVRDSAELAMLEIGIKARGTTPRKSRKLGEGQRDLAVSIAGVRVCSGDRIVADPDGIVIVSAGDESADG